MIVNFLSKLKKQHNFPEYGGFHMSVKIEVFRYFKLNTKKLFTLLKYEEATCLFDKSHKIM